MYGDEHFKKYDKIAREIGIEELKKQIPLEPEEVKSKLKEDAHLNNIPLSLWDAWAGGKQYNDGRVELSYLGFWNTFRYHNFCHSLSERVCLLKHVARWYVAGEYWW
jgi:hypothetical protein